MGFLFSKRRFASSQEREQANKQEFDALAEAIKAAYSQVQKQPQVTLDAVRDLFRRVRSSRTLDTYQRQILRAYLHDAAGCAHLETGHIKEGQAALLKAAKVYANLPDKSPQVNNLFNQARAWMMRNDLKQTLACLEHSLQLAKQARMAQTEADVLYKLGVVYNLVGQEDKAQEVFGRGLLLAQQLGNRLSSAIFLAQFGQLYMQRGELDRARDYYERSCTVFEEESDLDNLMITYGQLDQLYRKQQQYEQALDLALKGLALARRQANLREENVFLQDLALIYFAQDNYPQAEEMARTALSLAQQLADREHQMRACELLGQVATQQKDFEAAQHWIEAGYALAQQGSNRRETALFLNDWAVLKLAQGDAPAALTYFEQLAALFKSLEDLPTLVTVYVRMGDTYLENLHDPQSTARMAQLAFEQAFGADSEASMFAFTSTMRLIQALAKSQHYTEGLLVAGHCLEQANLQVSSKGKDKRLNPLQEGRWLLFVQMLMVLVATLQDLSTGTPNYQAKVGELLDGLKNRFGDSFTLESWVGEMYERLK